MHFNRRPLDHVLNHEDNEDRVLYRLAPLPNLNESLYFRRFFSFTDIKDCQALDTEVVDSFATSRLEILAKTKKLLSPAWTVQGWSHISIKADSIFR